MPDSLPTSDPWWDAFKQFICEIYKLYGGDCANLDWGDQGETAVGQVQTEFNTNGLPSFDNPTEEQAFWDTLDNLEENIGHPNIPPSEDAKTAAQNLIDDMRGAQQS